MSICEKGFEFIITDHNLLTIAEIRAALGVNEKMMLSGLLEKVREIRRNAERYEKVRKLTPQEFSGLWLRAQFRPESLDTLIDAWIDKPTISRSRKTLS